MIKKIKKAIKNPELVILYLLNYKIFRLISDELFLKIKYRLSMGEKLNLHNPITYNEKIQWLKLYDRKKEYSRYVDKFEVRKHIEKEIGKEYLIPLLGIYNGFDEINFDELPEQFVLKPTHTSGNIYICKDKTKIDFRALKKEVNSWLKREYFWIHREWQYKNIRPRIICEKYMLDDSGTGLIDYKFLCFNGEPKCIFICSNRYSKTGLNIDIYDMDWNLMPVKMHYPISGKIISKPITYDLMVKFSKRLSMNIPFVRIDFYEIDGKLYFGELTFHSFSGFVELKPQFYDELLGSWIELS